MRTRLVSIATGLALLFAAPFVAAQTGEEIASLISTAKTPADHAKIADYFAQKAASYETDAKVHGAMSQSYQTYSKGQANLMKAHCGRIKSSMGAAAKDMRELEKAHRQLATSTTN
jgi:hypothetical protein